MRVLAFLISPQAQRFILTAGVVTEADGREGTSLVSGNIMMVIQHPSPYLLLTAQEEIWFVRVSYYLTNLVSACQEMEVSTGGTDTLIASF